ncbi:MAG: hypothetical protein WAO41_06425 [Candidatus Nanopelagicales bacterium]
MSALLWWLIPLGATLAALGWAAWRSRPARQIDMHSSMSDQERFRAAMQRPMPGAPSTPTVRAQRSRARRASTDDQDRGASSSKRPA